MVGMHVLPLTPSDSIWILEECNHQIIDPLLFVGRHLNPPAKKKKAHSDPGKKAKVLSAYMHVSEDRETRAVRILSILWSRGKKAFRKLLFWDRFLTFTPSPWKANFCGTGEWAPVPLLSCLVWEMPSLEISSELSFYTRGRHTHGRCMAVQRGRNNHTQKTKQAKQQTQRFPEFTVPVPSHSAALFP